jgi:hypothetical protein
MAIKVVSIDSVPIMQPDETFRDEEFATLQILHGENVVAGPRVPLADLPEGAQPGDFLKFVKAE